MARRGHLGLRTFAHILSDPRTRDIPLIMETPAYDVPTSSGAARDRLAKEGMGVWRTEVSVLNRLSGRLALLEDGDSAGGGGGIKDSEFDAWRGEIQEAVRKASALKDVKGKSADRQGKKAKRKKGEEDQDLEEDEGKGPNDSDRSCCEDH